MTSRIVILKLTEKGIEFHLEGLRDDGQPILRQASNS